MEINPTSWYIWEIQYLVRIPKIDTISTFELKTYGMYTTGNKELDKSVANEWITTYFNIAKMVEHFKEGTLAGTGWPRDGKEPGRRQRLRLKINLKFGRQ